MRHVGIEDGHPDTSVTIDAVRARALVRDHGHRVGSVRPFREIVDVVAAQVSV